MSNKKRGNPNWVKGQSANPWGRPRGQNSLSALDRDPLMFALNHSRWERFCFALLNPPFTTKTEAARRAGFSQKSAKFIGYRLMKKPVVRDLLRRLKKRISESKKLGNGSCLIPDYDGISRVYRPDRKAQKKRAQESRLLLNSLMRKRRT